MATYRDEKIVNVYANKFRSEWTNTDVRIRFGETLYISSPEKLLVVEERVGVTMTFLTAKRLRNALNHLIARYEEVNGEIVEGDVFDWKPSRHTPADDLEPVGDLLLEESEAAPITPPPNPDDRMEIG
jgi:hypothetical protein